MSMKKALMLASMAAAMSSMSYGQGLKNPRPMKEPKNETEEEREKRLEKEKIERYKHQGLTEFFYGEHSLWALNKKSADKKATKKGWI